MHLHKCPRCGARNRIVNECRCDPNNLPTIPLAALYRQPVAKQRVEAEAAPDLYLSAKMMRRLMRRHKVTIRELARRMNVTMKSIRQVRDRGTRGVHVLDYQEAICGEFTPRLRACLRYWRREVRGDQAA